MLNAVLAVAVLASAQFTPQEIDAAKKDPAKYSIDESSIKIEILGPAVDITEKLPPSGGDGGDSILILDQIINIGQKLWGIIEKNKPVVDVRHSYATALPKGAERWNDLTGWSAPKGKIYGLTAKNAYGTTVVTAKWQVIRTYGGGHEGRGKYLTAVTVEPLLVDVLWGYKFSLLAEVPDTSVVNVGTGQDPVAAMTATLKWRIETAIKDVQGKGLYYLQGDGLFQELGGPFLRGYESAGAGASAIIIP
jgi:hypothetical protein